jgi:hypothetical protein
MRINPADIELRFYSVWRLAVIPLSSIRSVQRDLSSWYVPFPAIRVEYSDQEHRNRVLLIGSFSRLRPIEEAITSRTGIPLNPSTGWYGWIPGTGFATVLVLGISGHSYLAALCFLLVIILSNVVFRSWFQADRGMEQVN